MGWLALLFLGLAAFLAGGVYSFARDRRWGPSVSLGVAAALCLLLGALYAWRAQ